MHQLDDGACDASPARSPDRGPICADSTVNSGPEALAAGLEQVQHGLGHQVVGFAQLSGHQVLDAGHAVAHVVANAASPKSTPATTVAGVLTRPTYWGAWTPRPTWWSSGAGPAGSAAAAWAARSGRDVLVIDSAHFPRDKACGDGLTPRAVAELERLGLGRMAGRPDPTPRPADARIRRRGRGRVARPVVPVDRQRGARAPNSTTAFARSPRKYGARDAAGRQSRWCYHDSSARVTSVTLDDGTQVGCRELIVADGARSTLGRVLGRRWHQETVYGIAIRGYLTHATPATIPWITSHLELRSPDGDGAARLRLDLPAGQRRGEHRRRRAGHLEAARRRGAATADVVLHRPASGGVGLRRRAACDVVSAAADGRRGVRGGRPELDADRRRRGLRQPAQRRGHRLRAGDRPAGRGDARLGRSVQGLAARAAIATTAEGFRWPAAWGCC